MTDRQLFDTLPAHIEAAHYQPAGGLDVCRNPPSDDLDPRFTYEATRIDASAGQIASVQIATLTPDGDRWHVAVLDGPGVVETREPIPAVLTGSWLRHAGWHHPARWTMTPLNDRSDLSDRPGYVYVIGAVGSDLVKVGHAQNVGSRLADLQCGSPLRLYLVAAFEGTREDETRAHRRFADLRRHGEWFDGAVGKSAAAALETTVEKWLSGDAA